MCTVSAFYWADGKNGDQGYEHEPSPYLVVTMNRDEAIERLEGAVKSQRNTGGHLTSWYPTDAVSQGTWFGVNDVGMVMALLNRYQDRQLLNSCVSNSRAAIIPLLLPCRSIRQLREVLTERFCRSYQPFDLLVFVANVAHQFTWSGCHITYVEHAIGAGFFYTSSSVALEQVTAFRFKRFLGFIDKNKKDLPTAFAKKIVTGLHGCRSVESPSWGINMLRSGRQTLSISQARVGDTADCDYWPLVASV